MKTYSDLTNEQLYQLHRVVNINSATSPIDYVVNCNEDHSAIEVKQGRGDATCSTTFRVKTGDFFVSNPAKPVRIWEAIKLCISWGVYYESGIEQLLEDSRKQGYDEAFTDIAQHATEHNLYD